MILLHITASQNHSQTHTHTHTNPPTLGQDTAKQTTPFNKTKQNKTKQHHAQHPVWPSGRSGLITVTIKLAVMSQSSIDRLLHQYNEDQIGRHHQWLPFLFSRCRGTSQFMTSQFERQTPFVLTADSRPKPNKHAGPWSSDWSKRIISKYFTQLCIQPDLSPKAVGQSENTWSLATPNSPTAPTSTKPQRKWNARIK